MSRDKEARVERNEPYDMTEASIVRPNGATELARALESDDINQGNDLVPVSPPHNDHLDNNRVSTSLDE